MATIAHPIKSATSRPDRPEWTAAKTDGNEAEIAVEKLLKCMVGNAERIPGNHAYDITVQGRVEVKHDKIAWSSGNCAIEVSYKGHDSGIMTTDATSWAIFISDPRDGSSFAIFISVYDLRDLTDEYRHRAVRAGEGAVCVLVPVTAMRAKGRTMRMAA